LRYKSLFRFIPDRNWPSASCRYYG